MGEMKNKGEDVEDTPIAIRMESVEAKAHSDEDASRDIFIFMTIGDTKINYYIYGDDILCSHRIVIESADEWPADGWESCLELKSLIDMLDGGD